MTKPQVQKKNEKIEPRTWSLKGFLHEIKRIHNDIEDRRFAFILGAGASINSNIKGAAALAKEWMEIIYHREHEPTSDYQNWLASNPLDLENWEPNNLAKHYPKIFEKCFEGDHDSGYAALEKAIKDGKPSLGYAVLAWILSSTRHRMVITTNFDNLVADAVSIYGGTYPHVIGHESLASYAKPLSRRPIVAKIHRDLFTDPKNTTEGTSSLEQSWNQTLKNIFKFYTPVFIGYGGNDGSLMDFLQSLDTKEISGQPFWCYYAPDGAPNDTIKQLMIEHNGVLVPGMGFDELMLKMGEVVGFERHKQITEIKNNSAQLINQIQEQMLSLNKETQDDDVKKILKPQNNEKQNWSWLDWQLHINEESNIAKQGKLYLEAINSLPDSYQLHGNYAVFLEEQGRSEDAEHYYLNAIKLEPNDADFRGNYATLLSEQGKLEEAEQYYRLAIKADPNHSNNLGNYANFLNDLGRTEEAEQYYLSAIELEPDNANVLGNYAKFLYNQGRLEDSEQCLLRAIEADSSHANNLGNYAILLEKQARFENAEHYYRRAIEIDPNHSFLLGNYALFLKDIERFEEANEVIQQALAIAPNDERLLNIKKTIQSELTHLEEETA
ncbi:tetratricopeptide repeat protein [Photobacterium leiognathi]|uniref:tetratricopeptide repeat protein n=1 Tax=Photobacterium leiognathi TaxID=553611 RepID=UPI0029818AD7|nr:tetratricopeptide repeat protein [Photobacterium leiognathi]